MKISELLAAEKPCCNGWPQCYACRLKAFESESSTDAQRRADVWAQAVVADQKRTVPPPFDRAQDELCPFTEEVLKNLRTMLVSMERSGQRVMSYDVRFEQKDYSLSEWEPDKHVTTGVSLRLCFGPQTDS